MVGGEKKADRLVTAILAVVIIIAVAALIYVNLPHEESTSQNNSSNNQTNEQAYLVISYGNESFNYTMSELMNMESYTGSGGYIKKSGTIVGPDNYTGVNVSTLLQEFSNLPSNYTLTVTASDGYTVGYTYDEIKGHVPVYDESWNETGTGNLTMIIAYKENGVLLNESTGGSFRVAFVDDGAISSSKLWARYVARLSIESS